MFSNARRKSALVGVIILTCYFYALSIGIAVPYYNWEYARKNGFAKWLFLGEIVPTLKGLVWPYYALHRGEDAGEGGRALSEAQINRMQVMTMIRSLNSAQQGTFISNTREIGTELDDAQLQRVIEFDEQALRSADSTDEQILNRIYPELGTRFKTQFCEGRRLFISGIRDHSRADLIDSKRLDDLWADWFMKNRKGIEDASNAAIQ